MRRSVLLATALFATPASAADTLLQTVDLTDQGWSAEGGEAKLFRMTNFATGRCKIEVVHYGETGRTTYRFLFGTKLNYAARREYRYPEPIASMKKFSMKLTSEALLSDPDWKDMLTEDFATYRAFFDPAKLAPCPAKK